MHILNPRGQQGSAAPQLAAPQLAAPLRAVAALGVMSLAILSACSGGEGVSTAASEFSPAPATSIVLQALATPRASTVSTSGAGESSAAQVYAAQGASVVNVTSLAVLPTRSGTTEVPRGVGSGFIWDTDGRVVTNSHVVEDANQLAITFQDRTTVPATLLGRDEPNDLAILQLDPSQLDESGRPIRDRLQPVAIGDSERVTIGEDAIAIGSPLGLQQTVTRGIVSAIRAPGEDESVALLGGAIQTDAAINPGNSGGPLFNAAGEVIGVNAAILSEAGGNIGIGFAIPINVVKRVAPQLVGSGCYRHPLIGVTTLPLVAASPEARVMLGVPGTQRGLLVQDASAGAAAAGVRSGERVVTLGGQRVRAGGDIIVAVDGRPVSTGSDLRAYVENNKRPGDTVTLDTQRGDAREQISVTLDMRPGSQTCRG